MLGHAKQTDIQYYWIVNYLLHYQLLEFLYLIKFVISLSLYQLSSFSWSSTYTTHETLMKNWDLEIYGWHLQLFCIYIPILSIYEYWKKSIMQTRYQNNLIHKTMPKEPSSYPKRFKVLLKSI